MWEVFTGGKQTRRNSSPTIRIDLYALYLNVAARELSKPYAFCHLLIDIENSKVGIQMIETSDPVAHNICTNGATRYIPCHAFIRKIEMDGQRVTVKWDAETKTMSWDLVPKERS